MLFRSWGLVFARIIYLINSLSFISSILAVILAVFLPLYFTFDWCGTDIFLFCGMPFIIYFYDLSSRSKDSEFRWKNYYLIGALVGLIYSLRYAAAFLLIGLFLVTLKKNKKIIKTAAIFLGFLTFFIPMLVYNLNATNKIGGNSLSFGDNSLSFIKIVNNLADTKFLDGQIESIISGLNKITYLFFSHLSNLLPDWVSWLTLLYFVGLIIWVLILFRYRHRWELNETQIQLLTLIKNIVLINVALIIFLIFTTLTSSTNFSFYNEIRYYYPLFPSMLFVVYAVFNYPLSRLGKINYKIYPQILKMTSGIFLGFFLAYSLTLFQSQPYKVFGFHYFNTATDLKEYPSNLILTRHPDSYQQLIKILEKDPKSIAISWAEDFDFAHTLNTNLRKRILSGPQNKQRNYTTSQPLKAYLIFNISKTCPGYCYYNSRQEVTFIKFLPDVKTIYFNKEEKIQILYVTIPKGMSLSF
mgnify:CR=1 FL=1